MTPDTDTDLARIDQMVKGAPVLLFMKGTPLFPQCGFSSRAVAILQHLNVEFDSVDEAKDAYRALEGNMIAGQYVTVDYANERPELPPDAVKYNNTSRRPPRQSEAKWGDGLAAARERDPDRVFLQQ